MDLRSIGIEGLADVEERRALLEADLDRVHRGCGELLALRGDERYGLALVPHLVLREERLVGRNPECGEVPIGEQRHVLPRDDRVDAGHRLRLRRVQLGDPRVMVRGAKRLGPERSGDVHVVDVRRPAGDVRDAVVAWDSCADDLHAAPPFDIVVCFPTAVVVRSNESPRAVAATASMIFE
jgi:hypothetical protein